MDSRNNAVGYNPFVALKFALYGCDINSCQLRIHDSVSKDASDRDMILTDMLVAEPCYPPSAVSGQVHSTSVPMRDRLRERREAQNLPRNKRSL